MRSTGHTILHARTQPAATATTPPGTLKGVGEGVEEHAKRGLAPLQPSLAFVKRALQRRHRRLGAGELLLLRVEPGVELRHHELEVLGQLLRPPTAARTPPTTAAAACRRLQPPVHIYK